MVATTRRLLAFLHPFARKQLGLAARYASLGIGSGVSRSTCRPNTTCRAPESCAATTSERAAASLVRCPTRAWFFLGERAFEASGEAKRLWCTARNPPSCVLPLRSWRWSLSASRGVVYVMVVCATEAVLLYDRVAIARFRTKIWESLNSNTRDALVFRCISSTCTEVIGTTTINGKLNIIETSGTATGANSGSIILDHENNGGASSITFTSRVNRSSDFGYGGT